MNEELIYQVLETVGEIPKGCVATYKQIACLIGREKNSRLVGKILANASYYGHYPCHRVVNFQGRLVPGWFEQKELLEKGEALYKEGSIKNEELKRDIKEKIKDNTNIQYTSVTKDDLVDIISSMSDEEKAELTELLKSKKEDNTECKDEKCGCESSNDSEEEKQDENND